MRIEDIDGPRKKTETIAEILDILQWVGINWDYEPIIQSEHLDASQQLMSELITKHLVYHCALSRKELEEALSAPHCETNKQQLSLRPSNIVEHNASTPPTPTNWRFIANHNPQTIEDLVFGRHEYTSNLDFVVWTKDNMPSYQLATVADDHHQKITHVVRGCDLLQSSSWQEQLYDAMGWEKPQWCHLPLVVGEDSKRLAKRHGDSRISTYRSQDVPPERIIGLIGMWTDTQLELQPMTIHTFLDNFNLESVQTENIRYTKEDERWLLG
jgi:glutamyl-tRNA synthetase